MRFNDLFFLLGLRRVTALSALLALLFLSACGPRATVHPGFDPGASRLVAVLPLKEDGVIARERSSALYKELISELRNSGFVVLEPEVLTFSSTKDFSTELAGLSERFGVGIIAQLEVASHSENDFFLGYYNTLAGHLRLHNPSGVVTVEVEHRESQRGGLLFQSGQIVQGISEQLANSRGENTDLLVSRFIRTVVRKLPRVRGLESDIEVLQATVTKPEVKLLEDEVAQICVRGSVNSIASVSFDGQSAGLREVTPGYYCTILRVKEFVERGARAHVELRTPFGSSRRESFSLAM